MKIFLFILALSFVNLSLLNPSIAASNANGYQSVLKFSKAAKLDDYHWTTDADVTTLKTTLAKEKRVPAGASTRAADESQMSTEFKNARNDFLKITTADGLNAFLVKLEANYPNFKEKDTQFFAAQLSTIHSLRGLIWKMIPVFQRQKVTHSFVLSSVKAFAAQMKILLPTDQWDAGFDYLAQPYVDEAGVLSTPFNDENEVVGYFAGPVYDSLMTAGKRIAAIKLNKNIVWDNKILYGKAAFQDDLDRFRLVGEIERLSTLAGIHATLAAIAYQRSYSLNGLINIYADMGKLYGVDIILPEDKINGGPSSERVGVLKKFSSFDTLFPDGGDWMKKSLHHLQETVRLSAAVWDQINQKAQAGTRVPDEAYLFDTSFAQTSQRTNKLRKDNALKAVASITQLRSEVTGELVTFDLPNFFNFPPQDLKDYLPNGFEGGSEWIDKPLVDGSGKTTTLKYRNYFKGRGNSWDKNTYKLIFPDVNNSDDIRTAIRILSQTWGTSVFAIPLSNVIE